jgi:hypothetical protein
MKATKTAEIPFYSSSHLFSFRDTALKETRSRIPVRVWRYLFAIPGRIWRAICFKVILITIFAMICGFFFGAVWIVIEEDSYEEYAEYDEKIEWLLYEAEI